MRDNGQGEDIFRGAIKPHDQNSAGTLYFRIKADPISDTAAKWIKGFEAGFMLVDKGEEQLRVGNARDAMAYSTLNVPKAPKGFQALNSAIPDPPFAYEYMRVGAPRFLVFKIEYVPGPHARVTAWLNPDLFFVLWTDGAPLKFTAIPPRAKFPVKLTVGAYQFGRLVEPKFQSAALVFQNFLIEE